MTNLIKTIAIHLPQFHPIPENDEWWGKGFTEWTNVAKAKPLFKGHYQPHVPTDLGFYDLRLDKVREAQASLAKEYSIDGFCYYHYWFNGKRLLNQPLDEIVRTQKPDFPYMLCWANENWTRRWDGKDQEVLMKQSYSDRDDVAHIRFLIDHFFSDSRYIRVDQKPFFLVYRPGLFPDMKKTLCVWREEAKRAGFPDLFIGYVQSFNFKAPPESLGFDCAVEFQPDFSSLPHAIKPSHTQRLLNLFRSDSLEAFFNNRIVSYKTFVDEQLKRNEEVNNIYKTVCPGWDNSPRRQKNAIIFQDSSPEVYEKWLRHVLSLTNRSRQVNKFIFINAWNEWAEGNHLEPCVRWGKAYLEATRRTLQSIN